jgi:hypothetical protein
MKVGDTYKTSTGGTVTITKTGLIHKSGNAYSSKIVQQEVKPQPVKKKD